MRSGGDNGETILNSRVCFLALISSFFLAVSVSAAIPTAEDVNNLSNTARRIYDNFIEQSFELRIRYEFSNKFIDDADRKKLYQFAKTASDNLAQTEQEQKKLKQKIEDYDANDWDQRYGSTGLWRKLSSDIYTTALTKCEIDFYVAISSAQKRENIETLHKVIDYLESLEESYDSVYLHFIKARVFALLAQDDLLYRPLAKREFNRLLRRSDIEQMMAFRIEIEQIKLLGETEANNLDTIIDTFADSDCGHDIELVLSLAFLQRNLGRQQAFEKILRNCPQTQNYVGSILLTELVSRTQRGKLFNQILQDITVYEAELVTEFLWTSKSNRHNDLLQNLAASEKLQSPLILYVTAIKLAQIEPAESIELLIKASKLQNQKHNDSLDIKAEEIAKLAAQFAYEMYLKNSLDCRLVVKAFENYSNMSRREIDGQLQYCYVYVLNDCSLADKGKETLQKLALKNAGYWSGRAKLDLIEQQIEHNKSRDKYIGDESFSRLRNFIEDCAGKDKGFRQLRDEALTIYSKLRLGQNDKNSAQDVVYILSEDRIGNDPNLYALKSAALHRLGHLEKSIECLLKASQQAPCRYTQQAMVLLSEIIENADSLEYQEDDFFQTADKCKRLAQIYYKCLEDLQAGLFLAEISVFAANKDNDRLSKIEKLLNNLSADYDEETVDLIRCRARLLTAQQKFEEAAKLWSRICKIQKTQDFSSNTRSFKWWRAKYYELYCWSKLPQAKKQTLVHTIEVLENTFRDVPLLWAEKLKSLKNQRSSRMSTADK